MATATKVIGVVADMRRDAENDYACDKCCIFGVNEEEYIALSEVAVITPRRFTVEHCDRIMVRCSPWRAMRVLGENFGYTFTVTPLGGRIEGPTGERRTEIWTMVSSIKSKPNQV